MQLTRYSTPSKSDPRTMGKEITDLADGVLQNLSSCLEFVKKRTSWKRIVYARICLCVSSWTSDIGFGYFRQRDNIRSFYISNTHNCRNVVWCPTRSKIPAIFLPLNHYASPSSLSTGGV